MKFMMAAQFLCRIFFIIKTVYGKYCLIVDFQVTILYFYEVRVQRVILTYLCINVQQEVFLKLI